MDSSEKAKMLRGELYDASDPELVALRTHARSLVALYNATEDGAEGASQRRDIMDSLLGRYGSACFVEPPFRCDYGFNIRLGDSVYMNFDVVILDCALVTIGDHVLFGPGVHVYAATHPVEPPLRRRGYHDRELACPVSIGNNVWLGGRSVILPGVTIGDYAVIGAGAVVTRDVPAYAVVAGNPAKVIRVMQEEEIFTV
uniref:Maltose/galactoside acetyltransferase domain-containing protein n=1 Tax=Compsopogon caeruleus TaxID=31354 RepID=A0A7S1T6H0_9RHOD|mmetsp:Transcript_11696/g.23816  ORF Transcript_11696/g.23816 Transcript_11696/m.23816 type:complete len:199 (+) Transcript_11696:465-1061(+)